MKVVIDNEGTAYQQIKVADIQGDMGENTRLQFIQQPDGDVVIAIFNTERGTIDSIEFCSASGGGHYPDFTRKLRECIQVLREY